MPFVSINKNILFGIFQKNGLHFGKKFISECFPDIAKEIEKKDSILIKNNEVFAQSLFRELKNMKRKWSRLNGGNQRFDFKTSLKNENLIFEADIGNLI